MPLRPPSSSLSNSHRVKLVVAYDGSDFCGWAPQRGQRTVRGTLTDAVRQVSGEDNEICGASRTDSGAHAIGMVCHFDTEAGVPTDKWPRVLNNVLPRDVVVKSAEDVDPEFHSRFWALHRWYRYRIQEGFPDPRRSRYAFQYGRPLDARAMDEAAQRLVGQHDFWAFSQLLPPETNTVRRVLRIGVRSVRDEVWIDVVATAFCRGMMRRISGALFDVGRGKRDAQGIDELLRATREEGAHRPVVLPASGLTLMKVFYGRRPKDQRGRFDQDEEE